MRHAFHPNANFCPRIPGAGTAGPPRNDPFVVKGLDKRAERANDSGIALPETHAAAPAICRALPLHTSLSSMGTRGIPA